MDIGTESLIVERISLLFTVFRKVADFRMTQVPNVTLSTNWIDNITRSNAMRERLSMFISFDTTLEDIQLLRDEMQKFVLEKENSRDFQPEIEVEVAGIAQMDKLELKVEIRHKVCSPVKTRDLADLSSRIGPTKPFVLLDVPNSCVLWFLLCAACPSTVLVEEALLLDLPINRRTRYL